jgi:hypothetical protein
MSEVVTTEIAVGDQVRVHFHPPGPWKSFSEGVVRRVDVVTQAGRFFVLEVAHEVILDREHRIRPNFQDYVRYECRNDFPGRIEILSTAEQDVERDLDVERSPASNLLSEESPKEPQHEADEQHSGELDVYSEPEIEQRLEAEINSEPAPVDVEPQPVRKQGGLLSALFGRRR